MTRRAGRESRNADYILIAAKGGDTTTLGPKARRPFLHNPPPSGGPNLRRQARPFFKNCGGAATTTLAAAGCVKL